MEQIKVIVAEANKDKRGEIIESLSSVEYIRLLGEASFPQELLGLLERAEAHLLLLGADFFDGDRFDLMENLLSSHPDLSIILLTEQLDEENVRQALYAGVKDLLLFPFTPARLVDAVYRCFQAHGRKKAHDDSVSKPKRKEKTGQVIAVFSSKGGVGKTFVSTNLAVALAQESGKKVALVDLDLEFGSAALALNIAPRYTVSHLINEIHNLDQELLESYMTPHRSGLKLLAAGTPFSMTEFVSAAHIEKIIKVMQSFFDYIILDLPARFNETVAPAFQEAEMLLLVAEQEISAIRNIKAFLSYLYNLNYPRHKIKLLLNKADSHSDIRFKDVEATLNHSIFAILPAEYKLVSSSLNKGIPLTMLYPRSKVSRSLRELARRILNKEREKKAKAAS